MLFGLPDLKTGFSFRSCTGRSVAGCLVSEFLRQTSGLIFKGRKSGRMKLLHRHETSETKYPVRQCRIPLRKNSSSTSMRKPRRSNRGFTFKIIFVIFLSRFITEQPPSIKYIRAGLVYALRHMQC